MNLKYGETMKIKSESFFSKINDLNLLWLENLTGIFVVLVGQLYNSHNSDDSSGIVHIVIFNFYS